MLNVMRLHKLPTLFPWKHNKTKTMAEPKEAAVEELQDPLFPCRICGRTFLEASLVKHGRICERNAAKKRKVFNSLRQRVEGTDLAIFHQKSYLKKEAPSGGGSGAAINTTPSKSKLSSEQKTWKEKHDQLVDAIRAARNSAAAQDTKDVKEKPSTGSLRRRSSLRMANVGFERCPCCERQFGPKAYDRHVEWCKERTARLPHPSTNTSSTLEAKERLEARIKYKVPPISRNRRTVKEKYASPVPPIPNIRSSSNLEKSRKSPLLKRTPSTIRSRERSTESTFKKEPVIKDIKEKEPKRKVEPVKRPRANALKLNSIAVNDQVGSFTVSNLKSPMVAPESPNRLVTWRELGSQFSKGDSKDGNLLSPVEEGNVHTATSSEPAIKEELCSKSRNSKNVDVEFVKNCLDSNRYKMVALEEQGNIMVVSSKRTETKNEINDRLVILISPNKENFATVTEVDVLNEKPERKLDCQTNVVVDIEDKNFGYSRTKHPTQNAERKVNDAFAMTENICLEKQVPEVISENSLGELEIKETKIADRFLVKSETEVQILKAKEALESQSYEQVSSEKETQSRFHPFYGNVSSFDCSEEIDSQNEMNQSAEFTDDEDFDPNFKDSLCNSPIGDTNENVKNILKIDSPQNSLTSIRSPEVSQDDDFLIGNPPLSVQKINFNSVDDIIFENDFKSSDVESLPGDYSIDHSTMLSNTILTQEVRRCCSEILIDRRNSSKPVNNFYSESELNKRRQVKENSDSEVFYLQKIQSDVTNVLDEAANQILNDIEAANNSQQSLVHQKSSQSFGRSPSPKRMKLDAEESCEEQADEEEIPFVTEVYQNCLQNNLVTIKMRQLTPELVGFDCEDYSESRNEEVDEVPTIRTIPEEAYSESERTLECNKILSDEESGSEKTCSSFRECFSPRFWSLVEVIMNERRSDVFRLNRRDCRRLIALDPKKINKLDIPQIKLPKITMVQPRKGSVPSEPSTVKLPQIQSGSNYDPFSKAERQLMELFEESAIPPAAPAPVTVQNVVDEFVLIENFINDNFGNDELMQNLDLDTISVISAKTSQMDDSDTFSIDPRLINDIDNLSIPDHFDEKAMGNSFILDTSTCSNNKTEFNQSDQSFSTADVAVNNKERRSLKKPVLGPIKSKISSSQNSHYFINENDIKEQPQQEVNFNEMDAVGDTDKTTGNIFTIDDDMYEEYKKYEQMYLQEKEERLKKEKEMQINQDDTGQLISGDSAYGSLNRNVKPKVRSQLTKLSPLEPHLDIDSQDSCIVQSVKTHPSPMQTATATDISKQSKFCHECGHKYPVTSAKFCVECGVKRLLEAGCGGDESSGGSSIASRRSFLEDDEIGDDDL